MSKVQYRVLLNGEPIKNSDQPISNEEWSRMADRMEARMSGKLTLQDRLVVTEGIEEFLLCQMDHTGYIKLKNMVICPWMTRAEIISQ